jgi:predicted NUDIX family NTP pyrophosphohydrolase
VPKRSAGLLLYRRSPSLEVLLAHPGGPLYARRDDGVWTVPKGEPEPGEEPLAAAYREFAEELGVPAPAGEPVLLGDVRYSSGKVVTAWALEGDLDPGSIVPGLFEMAWRGRVEQFPEIDRVGWLTPQQGRVRLLPAQHPFLDRLEDLLA